MVSLLGYARFYSADELSDRVSLATRRRLAVNLGEGPHPEWRMDDSRLIYQSVRLHEPRSNGLAGGFVFTPARLSGRASVRGRAWVRMSCPGPPPRLL